MDRQRESLGVSEADHQQAQLFVGQLEAAASELEQQIAALEAASGACSATTSWRLRADAHLCRTELYETLDLIDALTARFPASESAPAGRRLGETVTTSSATASHSQPTPSPSRSSPAR